jgi:hypothetical protein
MTRTEMASSYFLLSGQKTVISQNHRLKLQAHHLKLKLSPPYTTVSAEPT